MAEKQAGFAGEPNPDCTVTAKAGPEVSSPGTSESRDYDSNCVFCRVAAGQEPETELLYCEVGGDRPGWVGTRTPIQARRLLSLHRPAKPTV